MKKLFYLLIAVLMVAGLYAGYLHSGWSSYHDFEGKCLDCHLAVPEPGGGAGTLVQDVSVMCNNCHSTIKELSHPVDKTPSMRMPDAFPVDWKGQITCVTCHPAHQQGYGTAHLRVSATGAGFCVLCHSSMETTMHNLSTGSAHMTGNAEVKFAVTGEGVVLDEISLRCLSCHDAVFGPDAVVESPLAMEALHKNNLIGVSHPIGVSYIEAKRKYHGAYRDVDKLPKEITLFEGMVGCASCHSPFSDRHFDLVMSNEKSALCLACHVK